MEEIIAAVSLICCGAYREDDVVSGLCLVLCEGGEKALKKYAGICERLLSRGETLSEYLFYLAVDAENPIMEQYLENGSVIAQKAVENDISTLSRLSRLSAETLISRLKEHTDLSEALSFPLYETGNKEITVKSVTEYIKSFGSSVFEKNKAFRLENGILVPSELDPIRLSDLKKYHLQRQKLIDNTICLIGGCKAQNALLYGDRGTGKSSTVKAIVNEYPELRIIQVSKDEILSVYNVYRLVKNNPLKFIIFIDDISFGEGEDGYSRLKQVLEGSVVSMPENCVIYATTNRRRILKETQSEREGDELHAADARDENMSLADRFGLYITFSLPGKDEYLDIVRQIAADRNIKMNNEELGQLAERFALKKCGRSPRTAKQFVDMIASQTELDLDHDF